MVRSILFVTLLATTLAATQASKAAEPQKPKPAVLADISVKVNGGTKEGTKADPASLAEKPEVKYKNLPYLGLAIRKDDRTGACLVSAVMPGPLEGNGMMSRDIFRGDTMLAINDKPVNVDNFVQTIRSFKPGDKLKLTYKRTGKSEMTAVPDGSGNGAVMTKEIVLDSAVNYITPLQYERATSMPSAKDRLKDPDALEKFINEQIIAQKIDEPVNKLFQLFKDTDSKSFNMLSRVSAAFQRPNALPAIERDITNPLTELPKDPRKVLAEAADNLDVSVTLDLRAKVDLTKPVPALESVSKIYAKAEDKLNAAFADTWKADKLAKGAEELLGVFKDREVEHKRILEIMSQARKIKYPELFQAAAELSGLMIKSDLPANNEPKVELPAELKDAVKGDVLAVLKSNGRWFVFGANGENVYDMSKVDVVIDAGGENEYKYPARRQLADRPLLQIIIDMAGDAEYTSDTLGAGAGIAGISLIVDYTGTDWYTTKGLGGDGLGCFGIGIVLDFAGHDIHRGEFYSQGVGYYGAGIAMSLGGGSDTYESQRLSQGVGLPRGFGLLFDESGNDKYRANGPAPSIYDMPAVYSSQSQGFGFGFRQMDTGGIGTLMDLSGNDRYEAGEFGQGCGYFYSIGLLNDRAGDDFYYGNRYVQGASAHQAFGILVDDLGCDTYWGNIEKNQGGGWDIGMGMALDREGTNTYYAGDISQGSGAMQGIGWLLNLGGRSHFTGPHNSQGHGAGNQYHYEETKCFSFSLLLNTSGEDDFYSQKDRANGTTKTTGEIDEKNMFDSKVHGLFIDTPKRLELK